MFEKFTEGAINIVSTAQKQAFLFGHDKVYSEHLLLGIIVEAKGASEKLLRLVGMEYENVKPKVEHSLVKKVSNVTKPHFSDSFKEILTKSFEIAKLLDNSFILPEHLFLGILETDKSGAYAILKKFDIDIKKAKSTLYTLIKRKKENEQVHPEQTKRTSDKYFDLLGMFENTGASDIFESAASKLSALNYEILGTEQIMLSVLENKTNNLTELLEQNGITKERFECLLSKMNSRSEEFDQKKIIFTPNAFKAMILALETAKELGSAQVSAEHIVLGILKSKSGIAYKIIDELASDTEDLGHKILAPIEKQMPETLTILRLAKQEARRLNKNILGSEMILLGIIGEGTAIGARVLSKLGITLKDARSEVEALIGSSESYENVSMTYTPRARKILEIAWEKAKKHNTEKIQSQHLLYAITKEPTSLAMKVLINLGVDVLEIRHGILKELFETSFEE